MNEKKKIERYRDAFWSNLGSGALKICATSLLPLIFWSFFGDLAKKIEDFFGISNALRPLFLSTVLVALTGLIIYAVISTLLLKSLFVFELRTGKTQFDGKFKNSGTVDEPSYFSKSVGLRIKCEDLPGISWSIIKLFRIKITLKTDPNLISVRTPDGGAVVGAYVSRRGFLKIDLSKKITGKNAIGNQFTTTVVLVPYSVTGTCNLYAQIGLFPLGRNLMHVEIKKNDLELR